MKLVKRTTKKATTSTKVENSTKRTAKKEKLPEAVYHDLVKLPPILVRDYETERGNHIKKYIIASVRRANDEKDDIENPIMVYINMYQESDYYTGYLKGGISFPLKEHLATMQEMLEQIDNECADKGIWEMDE